MRAALLTLALLLGSPLRASSPALIRLPEGAVQPQALVDEQGRLHVLYLQGDPGNSDVYCMTSSDGGAHFAPARRLNESGQGAMAVGTIRGAHLALGRGGRLHAAWMRSGAVMLYTRSIADGSFEKPKNVLAQAKGLDGGGTVAADRDGRVYVAWHSGGDDEAGRKVWLAVSRDEGAHFEPEKAAWDKATGACGCCGMRAFADSRGGLTLLYRSATEMVHRDMVMIRSGDGGQTFQGGILDKMESASCLMSTASLGEGSGPGSGLYLAWETLGHVHGALAGATDGRLLKRFDPPNQGANSKHAVLAGNKAGETLMAWTEGTGWNQGGKVAWIRFGADGKALSDSAGRAEGLPVWGTVAVFDGPKGFGLIY